MNDKKCTNDCYDDGEQQVETLCTYCQSYFDSVRAEALREYKVSPATRMDKDRIKALGNSIVPQVIYPIMQIIKEVS